MRRLLLRLACLLTAAAALALGAAARVVLKASGQAGWPGCSGRSVGRVVPLTALR